jgi:hypothetical protein
LYDEKKEEEEEDSMSCNFSNTALGRSIDGILVEIVIGFKTFKLEDKVDFFPFLCIVEEEEEAPAEEGKYSLFWSPTTKSCSS